MSLGFRITSQVSRLLNEYERLGERKVALLCFEEPDLRQPLPAILICRSYFCRIVDRLMIPLPT
uniref:Uncharacterized protein n=1 Tax=viral metagenome TaxID=1070528 RepID=A0A6C0IXG7_9ZZZZ